MNPLAFRLLGTAASTVDRALVMAFGMGHSTAFVRTPKGERSYSRATTRVSPTRAFARPSLTFAYSLRGDPRLGDPPHEPQGWYGIYSDDTTIDVIRRWSPRLVARGS